MVSEIAEPGIQNPRHLETQASRNPGSGEKTKGIEIPSDVKEVLIGLLTWLQEDDVIVEEGNEQQGQERGDAGENNQKTPAQRRIKATEQETKRTGDQANKRPSEQEATEQEKREAIAIIADPDYYGNSVVYIKELLKDRDRYPRLLFSLGIRNPREYNPYRFTNVNNHRSLEETASERAEIETTITLKPFSNALRIINTEHFYKVKKGSKEQSTIILINDYIYLPPDQYDILRRWLDSIFN